MNPKPIRKAMTIFFSVGRMNFDRAYSQNHLFKNPDIFYTAGDKHFWPYENKSINIISVFQTLCK